MPKLVWVRLRPPVDPRQDRPCGEQTVLQRVRHYRANGRARRPRPNLDVHEPEVGTGDERPGEDGGKRTQPIAELPLIEVLEHEPGRRDDVSSTDQSNDLEAVSAGVDESETP